MSTRDALQYSRSMAPLAALATALAERDQPGASLRVLDRVLDAAVGHRLFTALLYRPADGVADRVYSSAPDRFPAQGSKALDEAPIMRRVLMSGLPYIARDASDITRDFPDHEKILALGCASILNMPVRWNGDVIGQVNLLHEAGHFHDGHFPIVEMLAQMVVPAFLLAAQQARRDGP
ncbi:MAG: GAF domain-containing protein [Bradyrhizobium sp.]